MTAALPLPPIPCPVCGEPVALGREVHVCNQTREVIADPYRRTEMPEIPAPTPECPRYEANWTAGGWFVLVDEGWRSSIVCTGMYEWAARWLVEQLQGKPFAPDTRPGGDDRG